ncbi:hypothetical protein ASG30_09275 [Ramlibacter sp. Leaf400]|nr:hypothetical protein ASG30_09275 [Ramlibacter sp. Leaf400]
MLENFVLIYPTDTAWDRDKRKQVKIANMAHMFGADYVRMWKGSADRKTIDEEDLVFDPTLTCGPEAINLYDGLSVAPVPAKDGECDVMLELLRHLCSRCDSGVTNADDVMEWVLRWLALPFQKRGAKMATALVFHGPQGTGKNLFFDVIRDMYGKYGVMVGQTEIEEKYNGWVSAKQLAVCNEVVSRQELYHHKNRLKWMIDAPKIPIRTMHTDTRWESNWCNFVFISNENKPLVLEVGDRRHLVVYTPTPEDRGLYDRVRAFLKDGGATKFLDYLIRYPMGDFHEHTKPLMTEAKEELISLGMSPDERFMAEWLDGYLHLPLRVCSAEQLYRAFQRWCQSAGERYVPPRASFTTTAKRWAMERLERDQNGTRLPPCLSYKIVNFPNQPTASSYRSARIWIPRGSGPLNGVTEGEWALGAVEAFEADLGRFLRARDTLDDHPPPPHGSKKGGGDGSVSSGA